MGVRYHVNESFFDIWSDEMAYVLGFMYADGHIGEYSSFRGKYVVFTNNNRDRLELIKRLLDSDHTISVKSTPYGVKEVYYLRIGNQQLFERLVELGVTPRKSLTMNPPPIPDEFFGSFLLGYFDGDGCVCIDHNKKRGTAALRVIYTSGSLAFLTQLRDYLRSHLGVVGPGLHKHGSSKRTYQLRYSTQDSYRIFLCMYKSSKQVQLGMPRKYAIFMKYLDEHGLRHDLKGENAALVAT